MTTASNHSRFALTPLAFKWSTAAALLLATASVSQAQMQQAYYQGAGNPMWAAHTANYTQGNGDSWSNAYGESVVVPAGFNGPGCCMPGGGCGPGMGCGPMMGGGMPCASAGGGPYGPGGPYGSSMDPSLDMYGSPNVGTDQCGPHYFDFSAEVLYWARADTGEPRVDFATDGIQTPPLAAGDAVLSTDDLNFDEKPGMRLTGRYDLGALSVLEIGYSGLFEWNDSARVTSAGNTLFSPFSEFGTDPFGGAGLTETDAASSASIEYWSELHNAEISFRRYWIGNSPRVTGTWLAGFRYTKLSEDFFWNTQAIGTMDYQVTANNDLAGFQTGGDVWVTARQGIRFGAQGKVGLYNNRTKQSSRIEATTVVPGVREVAKANHVAFIGEGNLSMVCDVMPSMSIRAGYDVLFINTVALAPNNVNFNNELFSGGTRTSVLIEESSVLYHGANLGLEYVW